MKRKEKMIELRKKGLSYGAISKLYNISRSRVHQLTSGYTTNFNQKLRQLIFERDEYKCQWSEKCGGGFVNRKDLIIHHIDFDNKNNNPNNLITLCKRCHSKFHSSNHIDETIENKLHRSKKMKIRNEEIYKVWQERKNEITMEDLADMFNISTGRIYQILKADRERKTITK